MRTDSGLKKNRKKIQMVLTALVILSVYVSFFKPESVLIFFPSFLCIVILAVFILT